MQPHERLHPHLFFLYCNNLIRIYLKFYTTLLIGDKMNIVPNIVEKELNTLSNKPISEIEKKLSDSKIDLVSILMNFYEKFITEQI